MKDVRLTQLSNGRLDIKLTDGKTEWCEDGVQAVQHAIIRLMKMKGESVTDNPNEDATDYYGIIFNAQKTKAEKILHIKKRVLGTPGIKRFVTFEFEQTNRSVSINATIETDWGTTQGLVTTLEPF